MTCLVIAKQVALFDLGVSSASRRRDEVCPPSIDSDGGMLYTKHVISRMRTMDASICNGRYCSLLSPILSYYPACVVLLCMHVRAPWKALTMNFDFDLDFASIGVYNWLQVRMEAVQ